MKFGFGMRSPLIRQEEGGEGKAPVRRDVEAFATHWERL